MVKNRDRARKGASVQRDLDEERPLNAGSGRPDNGDAFIDDPQGGGPAVVDDDLAESLAEQYLHAATSGEDMSDEVLDAQVPEEIGGPFVETSPREEFADDVDETNPDDATSEPLPRAVSGLAVRPPEDR
jgi:hypothetical protein